MNTVRMVLLLVWLRCAVGRYRNDGGPSSELPVIQYFMIPRCDDVRASIFGRGHADRRDFLAHPSRRGCPPHTFPVYGDTYVAISGFDH